MKNGKFLEKYHVEEDRQKQLSLLKDYMLSIQHRALFKNIR